MGDELNGTPEDPETAVVAFLQEHLQIACDGVDYVLDVSHPPHLRQRMARRVFQFVDAMHEVADAADIPACRESAALAARMAGIVESVGFTRPGDPTSN